MVRFHQPSLKSRLITPFYHCDLQLQLKALFFQGSFKHYSIQQAVLFHCIGEKTYKYITKLNTSKEDKADCSKILSQILQ